MNGIVYTSNSGFTAQYAEMLGGKLDLPVYSLKEARKSLSAGAEILYLGWLMAGQIQGCKEAARLYSIKAVCGVGMGAGGSQLAETRKSNAIPESTALFTLQGGFDITRLHGIYKFMMRVMQGTAGKKLAQKPDKTAEEADMLDLLQNGGSRVSEDNLRPVLEWYRAAGEKHDRAS